jgi:hypothetical protein
LRCDLLFQKLWSCNKKKREEKHTRMKMPELLFLRRYDW